MACKKKVIKAKADIEFTEEMLQKAYKEIKVKDKEKKEEVKEKANTLRYLLFQKHSPEDIMALLGEAFKDTEQAIRLHKGFIILVERRLKSVRKEEDTGFLVFTTDKDYQITLPLNFTYKPVYDRESCQCEDYSRGYGKRRCKHIYSAILSLLIPEYWDKPFLKSLWVS